MEINIELQFFQLTGGVMNISWSHLHLHLVHAGAPTIVLREAMEGEEGCDVSIVAKVSGCPFPTLTWQKASVAKPEEKAAVQYDQHMNKLVTQDKCTLLIQQASRNDSALYSLTASNSLGTVTKDIKLSVLGKNNVVTSSFHEVYLKNLKLLK